MMPSTQLNKNAFALSIVLWIVAALLFATAMLSILAKDTQSLTQGIDNKLKANLIAEDVLEILKFHVLTSDFDSSSFKIQSINNTNYIFPSQLILDNRWYEITEHIQIRVQDTSNMINVMKTKPESIAFLVTKDSQRQLRYIIQDSINDWRDKDNIVSLNGAEASRYELKKHVKYPIRNSQAIQSVDELRLINGLDTLSTDNWNIFKEKLYYGNGVVTNLTIADARYLAFLLNINDSQATSLIKIRNTDMQRFIDLTYKSDNFSDDYMGFSLSKQLSIEIKVTLDNAVSILKTLIDFRLKKDHIYTTIKYKTE